MWRHHLVGRIPEDVNKVWEINVYFLSFNLCLRRKYQNVNIWGLNEQLSDVLNYVIAVFYAFPVIYQFFSSD